MAQVLNAEYGRTILPVGELTQSNTQVQPQTAEAEKVTLHSVKA